MTHPDAGPVLDLAFLSRQTFGDAALSRELLGLFDGQCARLLPLIVAGDTGRERADAAHALRGAATAIGAAQVASALKAIEQAWDGGCTPADEPELAARASEAVAAARAAARAALTG